MAGASLRAYRKARAWLIDTPPAEIARTERSLFPDIDPAVLTSTIASYQKLGAGRPTSRSPGQRSSHARCVPACGLITRGTRYETWSPPADGP